MVELSNLIAHRFRGFSAYENSLEGLQTALDFGVKQIEFDIRVTKCGTPLIYHDEYALDKAGRVHHIKDIYQKDLQALGGVFAHMPTAEALFSAIATHDNKSVKILIDMKDAGFEDMLYALIHANRLESRALWVSWLPETLYAIHTLDQKAKLCLSHWCGAPTDKIKRQHRVFTSKDGHIARPKRRYVHGERSGWYVNGPIKGALRAILSSVCVPQAMVTRELVDNYHADGIEVSCFSYVDWDHINLHKKQFNIDDYFIDNKSVFDEII
ncbi:MAG: glycerophosphodiester phosphodiesterase [Litorimonas sp.]